jgi:MFS family permease
VGGLISALFSDLNAVIVGCAAQGVAGALSPLAIGIAREHLPPKRVRVALGIATSAGMFGAGIAYLVGGLVVDHWASHGGFYFKVLVALGTMAAVALLVPRPNRPASSLAGIDLWRGVLFAPALAALLLAAQYSRSWGLGDARFLGLLLGGALLLAWWVRHQARQQRPLINVRMLAERRMALPNLATIFVALGSVQLGQSLSLLLQQPAWTGIGIGLSPSALGWVLLPLNAISVVLSPLSGRYGRQAGEHKAAVLGASVCLLAWLMLMFAHGDTWQIMAAAVVSTCGYAFLMPALYNLIARACPVESASEAAGASYVLFAAFMAVGSQLIFGILGSSRVSDAAHGALSHPSHMAWTTEFAYIAAMCGLCLAVLVPLAWDRRTLPAPKGHVAG